MLMPAFSWYNSHELLPVGTIWLMFRTWWRMHRKLQILLLTKWASSYRSYTKLKEIECSFLQYCFHFQLVQQVKHIVFVENTASGMFIPVFRRYLQIGNGVNWWDFEWEFKVQAFYELSFCPVGCVQRGRDSGDKGKRSLQSSPLLQHQTSTDDIDQPSSQLITTENRCMTCVIFVDLLWIVIHIFYLICSLSGHSGHEVCLEWDCSESGTASTSYCLVCQRGV